MNDKLTVKGLRALDGEYEFDRNDLLGSMTNRELHRIKLMAGVRAGEIQDALAAGDNDVLVALAAILLTQRGKLVDEDVLWDAPAGAGLIWEFDTADDEQEEGDAGPPVEPAETPETEPQKTNGGGSGNPPSDPSGNGRSLTGLPVSVTSATSAPATSAT